MYTGLEKLAKPEEYGILPTIEETKLAIKEKINSFSKVPKGDLWEKFYC